MKTISLTLEQRVQTFILLGFSRGSFHEMHRKMKLMGKLEPSETEKSLIKYQYVDEAQTVLGYDRLSPALKQLKEFAFNDSEIKDIQNTLKGGQFAPSVDGHWLLPLCEAVGLDLAAMEDKEATSPNA